LLRAVQSFSRCVAVWSAFAQRRHVELPIADCRHDVRLDATMQQSTPFLFPSPLGLSTVDERLPGCKKTAFGVWPSPMRSSVGSRRAVHLVAVTGRPPAQDRQQEVKAN
jgi:hypothetical protein